jgi:hypothetical protein
MLKPFLFSLLFLFAAPAPAAMPVELPAAACKLLQTCRLIGQGTLRWWGFHVYDAALWSGAARWQAQAPYALDIRYARRLTGAQLAETSVDELRRLGIGDEAALTRWGAAMKRLFPDVGPGSRLIGVHVPQRGALFYSATAYLGAIDEPEFARGFFAIWLDPRTQTPELRAALLGRDGPAE